MMNGRIAISEVAEINPRLTSDSKPEPDGIVSFVPMAAVSEITSKIEEPVDRPYAEVAKGFTSFRRGDVLIAKITPCFENGKIAYAANLPREQGFGSTEFHVLRPKSNLHGNYLFYLLRDPFVRRAGKMKMKGAAGQRRVPAEFLAKLQIPLPPLAEQKRIAAILDAADAIRRKRQAALDQLDSLLQSTFLDMFGDPVTNPKYPVANLGDHLTFITTGGRGWAKHYADNGARFIRSLDVQMNSISDEEIVLVNPPDNAEARRTKVAKNDVLLTMTGSRIGRVSRVPDSLEGAFISQHVAILRLDNRLMPEFTARFLSLDGCGQIQIRKWQYGQTKPGLNFKQVRAFKIPAPPLVEQKRFARVVESVEQQKAAQRKHLEELDTLFASLQSRAFNGEL